MTPLFKEKAVIELLATEINNNFTQQQKEKLHFLIGTSDIVDYAGIKLLAKTIKNYLVDVSYVIKHGQVLNILAKSYGFSNHHSMKASFEQRVKHYEGTTDVFKIFQVREELFALFNEKNIDFRITNFPSEEFILLYTLNNHSKMLGNDKIINYYENWKSKKYQAKIAVNKLVRKYGIKPHKNTLPLMKFSFSRGSNIYNVRYLLVKEYKAFFNKPLWMEENNKNYYPLNEISYIFLSYDYIEYKKAFLFVDRYSNDLEWDEIKNFLTFLIRYGEVDDFIFIESLLKQEKGVLAINRSSLSKNLLLRKYEKFKFIEDFVEQYEIFHRKSLKSILQSMKIVISLTQKDMQLLNQYANNVKEVIPYFDFMNNLSTILTRCCIENMNEPNRYREIEKTLYLDFLHYEDESKIIEVKSINTSTDIVLVSRLAQLVEVTCSRIEELIKKNQLELDNTMDLEQ